MLGTRIKDVASMLEFAAREWAASLEDRERHKSGVSLPLARKAVAARLGVSPGTLENLRRGRLKDVKIGLFETLRQAIINDAEREIKKLEHVAFLARAADLGKQAYALEDKRAALREALGE